MSPIETLAEGTQQNCYSSPCCLNGYRNNLIEGKPGESRIESKEDGAWRVGGDRCGCVESVFRWSDGNFGTSGAQSNREQTRSFPEQKIAE
jgi:hypothetical protein